MGREQLSELLVAQGAWAPLPLMSRLRPSDVEELVNLEVLGMLIIYWPPFFVVPSQRVSSARTSERFGLPGQQGRNQGHDTRR